MKNRVFRVLNVKYPCRFMLQTIDNLIMNYFELLKFVRVRIIIIKSLRRLKIYGKKSICQQNPYPNYKILSL